MRVPGGFRLGNTAALRQWKTATGKANFYRAWAGRGRSAADDADVPDARVFTLTTVRSHDQYNTTIYGLQDRYRGVHGERKVLFANAQDIADLGFEAGDRVDIESLHHDGVRRTVRGFLLAAYDIPRGCLAAYYPETNALVPLDSFAIEARTPTSKAIPVILHAHDAAQAGVQPRDITATLVGSKREKTCVVGRASRRTSPSRREHVRRSDDVLVLRDHQERGAGQRRVGVRTDRRGDRLCRPVPASVIAVITPSPMPALETALHRRTRMRLHSRGMFRDGLRGSAAPASAGRPRAPSSRACARSRVAARRLIGHAVAVAEDHAVGGVGRIDALIAQHQRLVRRGVIGEPLAIAGFVQVLSSCTARSVPGTR